MSKIEGISLKIYFLFKDNIFNLCQDIMFDIRFNGSCILIENCKATAWIAGSLESENKEKAFKQTKMICIIYFFITCCYWMELTSCSLRTALSHIK